MKTYLNAITNVMVTFALLFVMVLPAGMAGAEFSSGSSSSSGGSYSCDITADRTTVATGENVTVTWNTKGFNQVRINGELMSKNSGSKTYKNIQDNTTFKLEAVYDDGELHISPYVAPSCSQTVKVTCVPPAVEVECTLTPASQTIAYGGTATLNWTSKGGDGVVIDNGVGRKSANGSVSVGPLYETTNYTLTVDEGLVISPHIATKCQAVVKVLPPVEDKKPECTLTPANQTVLVGEKATLNWTSTNADVVTLSEFGNVSKNGTKEIGPLTKNTTYVLTVKDDNDTVECVADVKVKQPEDPKECALELNKQVNKTTAKSGSKLTYTITIKNIGDADCTGGGVRIFDVVDDNLTYLSHTITNNLSAGYGNKPVYTDSDRTLRFNGNTLTPGEVGTITWVGKVNEPEQCGEFVVKNQAKTTAKELNNFKTWVYSQTVKTTIDDSCEKIVQPACPYTAADGILVDFTTDQKLISSATLNKAQTDPKTLDLPAGDYTVKLVSWDGYEGRQNVTQPNEQYKVVILNDSNQIIAETGSTGDLQDMVKTALFKDTVGGLLTLDEVGASVYALHTVYPDDSSANSVVPICAVFVPEPETPAPSCDMFTANPDAIMVGGKATLNWESTNATQAFINNGIGAVAVDGSIEVSPLMSTTYVLTLIGAEDKTVNCEVPVTVSEDEVPVCELFTASPSQLPIGGGDVTLNWEVLKAETVTITPTIGTVGLTGTQVTNVTESTTFKLIAEDANGDKVSCEAPVTVPDPELLTCEGNVNFTASDYSIRRGNKITLAWSTTNVDSLSISEIGETSLSGTKVVEPNDDTTYVLTAKQGDQSVDCPIKIDVSSGGGGSSSPKCELEIFDDKIKLGDKVTISWDTTNASEVTLIDDKDNVIFTTDDYLSADKKDYLDHSIKVKPTRDTEYTLIAERGSKERKCKVEVEMDDITVLQTRDQQPLVAGISLSQVPYTGFEAGPVMTVMFYLLLVAWALYVTYLIVLRKRQSEGGEEVMTYSATNFTPSAPVVNRVAEPMIEIEDVTGVAPDNLPVGKPVIGYENQTTDSPLDNVATELENQAHAQKALLSSDAVRFFIATTNEADRVDSLNDVIAEAKANYPLEDGWMVINESRMKNLCQVCKENKVWTQDQVAKAAAVPAGAGSLAEAIVTGNVVAAYEMIGTRPMFSLADAAADLDAVYRSRKGENTNVSELLKTETAILTDEQIKNMIAALTGALDGTYTDEASAVKMAIMKAIREVS